MNNLTAICAWCKKVKIVRADESVWWVPEGLAAAFDPANTSHGICPLCLNKEKTKLAELKHETKN